MISDRPYMRRDSEHGPRLRLDWSATAWLIAINVAVYAAQLIVPLAGAGAGVTPHLETYFALDPDSLLRGQVWQLLTFQFLHGGMLHLILNCVMLYLFGRPVEGVMGKRVFVRFYLASGGVGGLAQVLFCLAFPQHAGWTRAFGYPPLVGASAGVFGVIAAFACMNPNLPITTLVAFVIPVSMRAIYLVPIQLVIAVLGMLDRGTNIAHAAHLGGLLAGVTYVRLQLARPFPWSFGTRRRQARPARQAVRVTSPRRGSAPGARAERPNSLPPADYITQEIDPILDKISAHGIQSLTESERRTLEAARERMGRP